MQAHYIIHDTGKISPAEDTSRLQHRFDTPTTRTQGLDHVRSSRPATTQTANNLLRPYAEPRLDPLDPLEPLDPLDPPEQDAWTKLEVHSLLQSNLAEQPLAALRLASNRTPDG